MYIFMGVFFACLLLFIISGIRDSWTVQVRAVHESSDRSFIFLICSVHLWTYASKIGHENKFEKRWEISLLKWKREHMIPVRVRRTRPVWTPTVYMDDGKSGRSRRSRTWTVRRTLIRANQRLTRQVLLDTKQNNVIESTAADDFRAWRTSWYLDGHLQWRSKMDPVCKDSC